MKVKTAITEEPEHTIIDTIKYLSEWFADPFGYVNISDIKSTLLFGKTLRSSPGDSENREILNRNVDAAIDKLAANQHLRISKDGKKVRLL